MKHILPLALVALAGSTAARTTLPEYQKNINELHAQIDTLHTKYKKAAAAKKRIPYNDTINDLKAAKRLEKQAQTHIANRPSVEHATASRYGSSMAMQTYSAQNHAKLAVKKLKPVVKKITRAQRMLA